MEFETRIAVVVADDLAAWRKLNVVAFLSSGVVGQDPGLIGDDYRDASGQRYLPLCVQPVLILQSARSRLVTFLERANRREVKAAVYIEDMFETGHDADNRQTVRAYQTAALPLVGIGLRAEKKIVDKIFKGARLHE